MSFSELIFEVPAVSPLTTVTEPGTNVRLSPVLESKTPGPVAMVARGTVTVMGWGTPAGVTAGFGSVMLRSLVTGGELSNTTVTVLVPVPPLPSLKV